MAIKNVGSGKKTYLKFHFCGYHEKYTWSTAVFEDCEYSFRLQKFLISMGKGSMLRWP